MKKLVLVLLVLGLFGCGKSEKGFKKGPVVKTPISKADVQREVEREKQRLLDSIKEVERIARENSPTVQERKNPLKYLVVTELDMNLTLFNDSQFSCVIQNKAKSTIYKDIQLKVRWFTNTGTLVREWNHTDYSYYHPNNSYKVKFEFGTPPKEGKKYDIVVVGALVDKQI
jgi:hypothetical protein